MNAEESTALTVAERAVVALRSDKAEQELTALATSSQTITVITNPAGRAECHAAAMRAADARITVEKMAKQAREDATKFSKAVIAEEARLVAIIAPEEKRLLAIRKEWDDKVEAEKEAKRKAEAERVAGIVRRIEAIKRIPLEALTNMTADRLRSQIAYAESIEIDDGFGEYFGAAKEALADALATLRGMLDTQVEADAKAEAERLEREERDRVAAAEREAAAARQKAEDDRLAAERAQIEAERKRLADEQEAARLAQKKADDEAAALRAEAARKDAEERAAAQATLDAERAELARQQAEIDEQRRQQAAEQQRIVEAAAAEQRKKDEAGRIEREANERRARIAALTAPTVESITQLVADQLALGDYATAARWLAAMDFMSAA